MPLRVLVLGGTGHLGAAIARAFAEAGHMVSATGRSARARPNLDDTDINILSGDDHDAATVQGWINGAQVVVDAATPYPLYLHQRDAGSSITRTLSRTSMILDQVREANAAFIHISSFTTLPHRRSVLGQVRQGMLEGLHSYFELKSKVEAEVKAALRSGVKGCVINPATCIGPYDLKPREQTFIPMLLGGQVKGLVNATLNVVDVRDVGAVALAACAQGYPSTQIPLFGHNVTLSVLAGQICAAGNVAPPVMKVPSTLGLAGLYWAETAYALTGRRTPWPSLPMMLLDASYPAAPSAAQRALLPHLRPLNETIEDAIHWYTQIGYV